MIAYRKLEQRFRRLARLDGASAVLGWDRQVMMPPGGAGARADQQAEISLIAHELLTDPAIGDQLDLAATEPLEPWQAANLREMRRAWRHATALNPDLVERLSRTRHHCEMVWRTARPADDYATFKPAFAEVLAAVREAMDAKAQAFGVAGYDALLDEYEPGASAERIDGLFAAIGEFLPGLIGDALERQASRPPVIEPDGHFPIDKQRALGLRFMKALGFDFDHGRLDVSAHPFTGGTPADVRITTRYREDDFAGAVMAVLHETGHALYEMGLPTAWADQPVGLARGMVLHESQSLLVEMQVSRGPAFLSFAAPLIRAELGVDGPAYALENLVRLYAQVRPGLIRVDADEVTYPAHVLLRYRLERALLSGDLSIDDLPAAWGDGMKTLLGVDVPDDKDGCLQDIHWPSGSFGYFPTYTLGAMAAAQLFRAARDQDAAIEPGIAKGDFGPLLDWLRANVHGQGSRFFTDELLTNATGAPLGVDAYRRHLTERYLG